MLIIEEHEALPVQDPLVVIYGPPGVGKTSLAFTANNPLLLDFDEGSARSVGRKRVVRFSDWKEVTEFIKPGGMLETMGVGTLIIDTAGAMLDELASDFVVRQSARNGKPGGGLGLQGFGAVKDIFAAFLRRCRQMDVLPLFICHAVEKQDGDYMRWRPKMTGGSYDILMGKADLVGYIEMKSGLPVLNFNPTDRHTGKNCVQFEEIKIPHFQSPEYAGFMQRIIDRTRERLTAMTDAQREALEQVKIMQDEIIGCIELSKMPDVYAKILQLPGIYQMQVMPAYSKQFAAVWKEQFIAPAATAADFTALVPQVAQLGEVERKAVKKDLQEATKAAGFKYSKEIEQYVPLDPPVEAAVESESADPLVQALANPKPPTKAVSPTGSGDVMKAAEKVLSTAGKKPGVPA